MRYRPFGITGKAVSAVSLVLGGQAATNTVEYWRDVIFTGLENGVNCFDFPAGAEAVEEAMGVALRSVERRLLFLMLRVCGDARTPLDAARLSELFAAALRRTGAGSVEVLMLDAAAAGALTADGREFLAEVRAAALAQQIGVSGGDAVIDGCIGDATFDVLATSFNLTSGWTQRRRLREATAANMVTIAYDPAPADMLRTSRRAGRPSRSDSLAGAGTYAFLHETRGWTAEELCLAYALTEPSLATIQCQADRADQIEALAEVTERDPPTSLGAQIEMARFSAEPAPEKQRA